LAKLSTLHSTRVHFLRILHTWAYVRAEAENVTSTQKYVLQLVVYQHHSVVYMLVLNPYFSSVAPRDKWWRLINGKYLNEMPRDWPCGISV